MTLNYTKYLKNWMRRSVPYIVALWGLVLVGYILRFVYNTIHLWLKEEGFNSDVSKGCALCVVIGIVLSAIYFASVTDPNKKDEYNNFLNEDTTG